MSLTSVNVIFNKYEGTGNDFIIIDNRTSAFIPSPRVVAFLCNRRFGIGADGLILVENNHDGLLKMRYFNSDGNVGSMCGNGGRCFAHFATGNGLAHNEMNFHAADGLHNAVVSGNKVVLSMSDVSNISGGETSCFMDTGSPHYIEFIDNPDVIDVLARGREIRYSEPFAPDGTNVNFVGIADNMLTIRTYERGVEDETLSCGTGVTASAIAAAFCGHFDSSNINIVTRGGTLNVTFKLDGESARDIKLTGPVSLVFKGEIEI